MGGKQARELLEAIGTRSLSLDHAAFDAIPDSRAVEHLRELLVHHRIMPGRGDQYLARFEIWLDRRLESFAGRPHIQQPLEQFGRWHHLRRLRNDPPPNMDYATRTAKQEITEAGKFMVWLEESQHAQIEYLTQEHIDLYWSEGPTTRTVVRNFLLNRKLIGRRKPLHAPKREAMTTPLSTPTERMNALRTVIEADTVKLSTRVAALIFLLYGTEIGRIATLKRDAIAHTPNGMTIELGPLLAPVPEPLLLSSASTSPRIIKEPDRQPTRRSGCFRPRSQAGTSRPTRSGTASRSSASDPKPAETQR
ncbi:hypothetical protein [Agromyces marinus]|nr:hypothetical protein [Agromyces marinus]